MRRPWPTRGCCAMGEDGIVHICNCRNRNGSVGIDAGLRDGQPWICFDSQQGQETFLFCKMSRSTLQPNLLPISGTGGVSPVVKSQSVKLTTYPISL